MTQAGLALVVTTILTALVHTLIPDHWLPFVLVSRAEHWTVKRTAMLTAISGTMHVAVSIGLGLMIVLAGRGAEFAVSGLAERLGALSGWLLMLFGVGYTSWFLFRGGHVHSFGVHPHHNPHDAEPPTAEPSGLRALSGYALTFIVGFNPCILVIPCIYTAGKLGYLTLAAVALAFGLSTVLSMVLVTLIGLSGTSRLTSPFLTRYGEAFSGALIALTGLVVLLAEQ